MSLAIPRGVIYHRLVDDLKWLFRSFTAPLGEGDLIREFERQFSAMVGRKHCVAFPFARTAIYFALKQQNFEKGSEIIMPPITIKGILDVVLELGLKPVFVDINKDTLCFDEEQLENAITSNTRTILLTYLFGMVPNVARLESICRQHGLFIIEDFSQCLNGRFNGKPVGSFGDIGVYSASSIKTLDTYGGGLLVCDDDVLEDSLRQEQARLRPPLRIHLIKKIITDLVRNLATSRLIFHCVVFPLLKYLSTRNPGSVIKHTGDRDKQMISQLPDEWFRSYTSLQARVGLETIGNVQILDRKRLSNVVRIKSSSASIDFPAGAEGGSNIYWQLMAYFDEPISTQKRWHSQNVDTATTSLLKISDLPAYPYRADTPNADRIYTNGLFIPCYPGLSETDLARITSVLSNT